MQIDHALEAHDAQLPTITWDPPWDELRRDPRYIDTLRRLGLSDFAAAEKSRLAAQSTP